MDFNDWPLRCEATFLRDVFNAAIKIRINVFFHISTIITNDENWRRIVIGITTSGPSVQTFETMDNFQFNQAVQSSVDLKRSF
jgi:hypothetical protein